MSYRSVFRPGLFSGKSIVITGGGSGIGRCTAHELVSLGAKVALVGRSIDKLQTVQAELGAEHASIHSCDIREEPTVKQTVTEILARHGQIDGLVNNAGGQFPTPRKAISLKGGGAIVNIIADMWNGMPGMGHSGAARAGMLNLTETAACEWAVSNVRVNAVAPGYVATSGIDTYPEEFKKSVRHVYRTVPLQRWGNESEISAAIVFLLCEASSFITGSCIRVDGGVPNARPTWPLPEHQRSKPFDGFHLYQEPKALVRD
jgi:citronellol/citronellal dehydrogenase